ncbi:hypothetical protein STENM327S_01556 [Streptomyces tendae]
MPGPRACWWPARGWPRTWRPGPRSDPAHSRGRPRPSVGDLLFASDEQRIGFIACAAAFFATVLVSTRHAVQRTDPVGGAVRTVGCGRWRDPQLGGPAGRAARRLRWSVGRHRRLAGSLISAEMVSVNTAWDTARWQDYTVIDYPGVFVGMVTIGVLGWLTSTAVERLGRRLTRWLHWSSRRTPSCPGAPCAPTSNSPSPSRACPAPNAGDRRRPGWSGSASPRRPGNCRTVSPGDSASAPSWPVRWPDVPAPS